MKIMFTGGGTAGHVNPAIAVADYMRKYEGAEILFCGGKGNIEEELVTRAGYPIYTFPMRGLSRSLSPKGLVKNVRAGANLIAAVAGCRRLLAEQAPDIVVGTGGYASFAMVYAAQQMGIKTALMEANAFPGITVKHLSRKADCVMISYAETARYLDAAKNIVLTGNPVREEILRCREAGHRPVFNNGLRTVVSFWGSVGALYMNRKMVDFMAMAAERGSFNHVHAAGKNHYPWMSEELKRRGWGPGKASNIDLREYIYDMDRVLGTSDLAIVRGGGSLSEICAAGLPSIIVPSPYVAENHQEKNARVLEDAGAALVIREEECTPRLLFETAEGLLNDPERLMRMRKSALSLAKPQALENIARTIRATAEK